MLYALAHDENGIPLQVPTTATGWLVRRHSGGRGRPGAVYDAEGRPLVVPLDSTTVELRASGCRPGMYRLDAVDGGRKPVGVTAYTEVQVGVDDPEAGPQVSAADAAVAALARAVEAMQRVQAERERMQAEVFMRLVERFSPAPVQPALDLKSQLGNMIEVQRTLKRISDSQHPRNAGPVEDEERDDNPLAGTLMTLAVQAMPLIQALVLKKMGLNDQQIGEMASAGMSPAAPATSPRRDSSSRVAATTDAPEVVRDAQAEALQDDEPGCVSPADAVARADVETDATTAKLTAVLNHLTAEERDRVMEAIRVLPEHVVAPIQRQILAMSPEDAASYLRVLEQQYSAFIPQKKAS